MPAATYDIKSANFDLYWSEQMSDLSPSERMRLPYQILRCMNSSGELSVSVAKKLTFAQKAITLMQFKGKRITIAVHDHEIDIEEAANRAMPQNITYNFHEKLVEDTDGIGFVLGGQEMIDGMEYLAEILRSPLYTFLKKKKAGIKALSGEAAPRELFSNLAETLHKYEANKVYILKAANISVSAFYILLYLGVGLPKKINKKMEGAIGVTKRTLQDAYYFLLNSGMIKRVGDRKTMYQITPHGTELLYKILINIQNND